MTLFSTILETEDNDDFHLSRILILLDSSKSKNDQVKIEGLTKLAKLDFLLRYPSYMERALIAIKVDPKKICLEEYEKNSIESKMIRFHYGPWDFRYRKYLKILQGKGLITISFEGRTVFISLTSKGKTVASKIKEDEAFKTVVTRSLIIQENFGVYKGTKLKNFIYETFPEIISLDYGEEIENEI